MLFGLDVLTNLKHRVGFFFLLRFLILYVCSFVTMNFNWQNTRIPSSLSSDIFASKQFNHIFLIAPLLRVAFFKLYPIYLPLDHASISQASRLCHHSLLLGSRKYANKVWKAWILATNHDEGHERCYIIH